MFDNQNIITIDALDSTNEYAKKKLQNSKINQEFVIICTNQTKGRGQGSNKWHAKPGKNLTLSTVLFPDFLIPGLQFHLSKIIALAVFDFIKMYSDNVKIKWPNDIYVGKKKIAGILIENTIQGNQIRHSIAGIGININQEIFPEELPNPTSICLTSGLRLDLFQAMNTLLMCIENRYKQLKEGYVKELDVFYENNLFQYKVYRLYKANNHFFNAAIQGVDIDGRIIMRDENDKELIFGFHEVKYIL